MDTDTQKQPTCKARWKNEKDSTIATLRAAWDLHSKGSEDATEDGVRFTEYGLSFDYVAPGTFNGQRRGYWRYQISWGGPSDEFRFYADGPDATECDRIEYWFLDWFDGHWRALRGEDLRLLSDVWAWFQGMGATDAEYRKARE